MLLRILPGIDMKNLKISFCIVCMNRLHHLEITLLKNIADNIGYPNLEFVILDYNSQDGMESWIKNNLSSHLDSGLIKYFRTPEPVSFIHSHSKNMAFRLASGEIICNINADHYIGNGFAKYVNKCFNEDIGIVITSIDYFGVKPNYAPASDVYGKVCVKKTDFLKVGGFDERITSYGYEDFDLVNRLELSGLKRSFMDDPSFLQYLSHGIEERFPLTEMMKNISSTYFHYLTSSETEILILYSDQSFKSGIFIDATTIDSDNPKHAYIPRIARFPITMKDIDYTVGTWKRVNNELMLSNEKLAWGTIDQNGTITFNSVKSTFYRVTDINVLKDMEVFMQTYPGRAVMEDNLKHTRIVVNESFGNGKVFKNFDTEIAYLI